MDMRNAVLGRGQQYLFGTPLPALLWKNDLHSLCCSFLICEMEIAEYFHFGVAVKTNYVIFRRLL